MKLSAKMMSYSELRAQWFAGILACHKKFWEGYSVEEREYHFNALIESIKRNDDDNSDDPARIIQNVLGGLGLHLDEASAARVKDGSLIVSLTHFARSEFASDRGDQNAAWAHLTLCSYWVSAAFTGADVEKLQKADRSRLASKGGRAKGSKFDPLKARARELFVHPPKGNLTWASLSDAGRGICKEIESYRQANHATIPSVTAKTLAAWITGFMEVNFMIRNQSRK